MKISGIYKIQSYLKPERIYIGSTINIEHRWTSHLSLLRKNKHHSIKLQRHVNKYGIEDLQFSMLLGCDKENLISTEQFFIDSYKTYFNLRMKADSNLGIKRNNPPWNKGMKNQISEETRNKMRDSHLGKPPTKKSFEVSIETRLKISIANRGKTAHNKGKKLSNEWKMKCRNWAIQNNWKPPSREGCIPWNKGKKLPPHTKELKAKQSEGLKKWWELRKLKNN